MTEAVEEQRQPGEPDEQAAESVLPEAVPSRTGWPDDIVVARAGARDAEPPRRPSPRRGRSTRPASSTSPPATGSSRARPRAPRAAPSASSSPASTARSRSGCSTARSPSSTSLGVLRANVTVMAVPGAFELPLAAMALAKTRRYACIVALGCVIRGDTPHFDYVAGEAASGLQLAALETGVPVSFGVLTTETERAGRGAASTRAPTPCAPALEMAHLFSQLRALRLRSATLPPSMSKVCAICGKGPGFGNNRSHSMVATKRRFNPNLQRSAC